jgi:hypothetical protein
MTDKVLFPPTGKRTGFFLISGWIAKHTAIELLNGRI